MSSMTISSILSGLISLLHWFIHQYSKNGPGNDWKKQILRRLAQLGALVVLTWVQKRYLQPLYLAMTRRALPTCHTYGQWVILILTDHDFTFSPTSTTIRYDSLTVQYAQFFLARKFHICFVVSLSTKDIPLQDPTWVTAHFRKVLLQGLHLKSRSRMEVCVLPMGGTSVESQDSYHAYGVFESHLGRMTVDGGIGMFIWCHNNNSTDNQDGNSAHLSAYDQRLYIPMLRRILLHMVFRKTGAIVGVVSSKSKTRRIKMDPILPGTRRLHESDTLIRDSMNQGSKAFITQLIRSLHYEYREYGIDCIAITNHTETNHRLDLVVKASLQLLGCEPELDMRRYSKFVRFVEAISPWIRW